ncbi:NarK family nitrate/nitrite MFS transporter [Lyngbya aestuarii]|uniref:NarK family nitrate/nitrite MFS transporter n=1 Tax=Lyngbya aestuarii TaxID=118322 RepID=UPI00403E242C
MLKGLASFSGRYRILHMTWFAFFLTFIVWFSFAPFATTIQKDLGLTAEQLKTLAICNLALTVPARIVIGMILDRFGPRITFSGLLIFAAIPCITTAISQNFDQLLWNSLFNGIVGAGFVVGVRMVAEWFPPKEIGIAQGIYGGWGNFGAAAAGFLLPPIAVATSIYSSGLTNWRVAILTTGLISAIYGVIYFFNVQDTPPGKAFQRPRRSGGLEVTSTKSFFAVSLLDLGLILSLGLLTWPLAGEKIRFLNGQQVLLIWVFLGALYLFQFYKSWQVNQELVGSINPFAHNFLKGAKRYPPSARYEVRQIALLSFTYAVNFGSQLAILSILPRFFEQTFSLSTVVAGIIAASYPFFNLISRPSGGLISDKLGSRKWTMTCLTVGIGIGYLLMGNINSNWSLLVAIAVTMFCSYFVQAGCGATFAMVPLIKREITGQISGCVGAYGNVGGVVYLTIYRLTDIQTLYASMGITALICASLCGFFLKEPQASFGEIVVEKVNSQVPEKEELPEKKLTSI